MILTPGTRKFREIARQLKVGNASIVGKVAEPGPWPLCRHYWIIIDLMKQETHHVLVFDRPSWKKYCKTEDIFNNLKSCKG